MCGISVLLSGDPRGDGSFEQGIVAMTRLVEHRGPDGEGFAFVDSSGRITERSDRQAPPLVAFGHRRLSIIDLSSGGRQPMIADDRYVLVFNGEIYNHEELRRDLEREGVVFRSHCDTEVLLHAWARWGESALQRLNGMFAFVIYDALNRRVTAVRDRFGIKPIYFWRTPSGGLAFASEIKQFTVLPGWKARLDGGGAWDFLALGLSDHQSGTFFQGVQALRGGELLELELGDLSTSQLPIRRWYELPTKRLESSFEQAGKTLYELLEDAVRLRLRADVAVGTCLSGGLDSSSIVCLASGLLRARDSAHRVRTFSLRSSYERFDEGPFIDEVLESTEAQGHHVEAQLDGLFETLDELVWHQDEPFASSSIFGEWKIFELVASNNIRVTLDGHGSDEILAGYPAFYGARYSDLLLRLRWLRLLREVVAARRLHGQSALFALRKILSVLLPGGVQQSLRRLEGTDSASADWIRAKALGVTPRDTVRQLGGRSTSVAGLSRAQLLHTSLPAQIHWADRCSMAFSVESRLPFLDHRLVEFATSLPDDNKLADATTKRVLRYAMADTLPEKVLHRRDKMGFVTPEEEWMRRAPERFLKAVDRALEQNAEILNVDAAQERARRVARGEDPFNFFVWRLICFSAWRERFGVSL